MPDEAALTQSVQPNGDRRNGGRDAGPVNSHHPFCQLSPEQRRDERIDEIADVLAAIVQRIEQRPNGLEQSQGQTSGGVA